MISSLYSKLALALTGLVLFLGALLLGTNLLSTQLFVTEVNQELHRGLARDLVKDSIPIADGKVLPEAVDHIFHTLMVINPAIEVYLLDVDGGILSYSAPRGAVVRDRVALAPIEDFLGADATLPILGEDPRNTRRSKPFSAAPIYGDGDGDGGNEIEGYLYIILGGQQYDSAIEMLQGSHILRLGFGASLAALLFLLLAGLLSFSLITRRVSGLGRRVRDFEASGFRHWPPPREGRAIAPSASGAGDEISRLSASFDQMAGRLVSQLAELEKTDALRRELVANVSHDLRTPLTSLRGYLETLRTKADSLSPTEQREYVDTALHQSERLSRLVTELFELAKLESATVEPNMEPFLIGDLIQDTVQDFRLAAEERGVELATVVGDPAIVTVGDVGLVARALENLIDNGIRHTPRGGRVEIRLDEQAGAVLVSVDDTGPGIGEQELEHLFDRYFRRSRGEEGSGSGLGLAIVRRIVQLHGGHLDVESEIDRGTRFSFDLPGHPGAAGGSTVRA